MTGRIFTEDGRDFSVELWQLGPLIFRELGKHEVGCIHLGLEIIANADTDAPKVFTDVLDKRFNTIVSS